MALKTKLGKPSAVLSLWRGPGKTDYRYITDGEEGFDARASEEDQFGRGSYFQVSGTEAAKS